MRVRLWMNPAQIQPFPVLFRGAITLDLACDYSAAPPTGSVEFAVLHVII